MVDLEQSTEFRVMVDLEQSTEFRAVWVDQVRRMLFNNESVAKACPLPRVARPLLNAKPEAYIPEFVSLGPYHHWSLEKDMDSSSGRCTYQYRHLAMSTAEACKVMSAAIFSDSLSNIVDGIKMKREEIASFYDWEICTEGNYSTNFALMMAVDSSFLLNFIFSLLGLKVNGSRSDIDLSQLQVCICDILKLENQIPLSVLKLVFHIVYIQQESLQAHFRDSYNTDPFKPPFKKLLWEAYKEISPFVATTSVTAPLITSVDSMDVPPRSGPPHLLGYIHAIVSVFLQFKHLSKPTLLQRFCNFVDQYVVVKVCGIFFCFTPPKERDLPINGYSAEQLARAGVKFKSFSRFYENIRFDECTHTLYLPRLTITSTLQTEVFFRNLVAFEFNDSKLENSVTRYVGLMDCLIDTPDDVRVLMDSQVICRRSLMLTHEHIAKLFDGMCQPFPIGHLEPPRELKEVLEKEVMKKYYKVKIKMRLTESWEYCYERYLSRPWKFVALLFAIFLLILNCIQAYCSLFKCKADN